MPLAVIATDRDGVPTHANREFTRCFGDVQFAGFPLADAALVHPDELIAARSAWKSCLEHPAVLEMEVRLRSADGSWRWVLARVVAEAGDPGVSPGWIMTLVDIDGRRRAEEAAQAANHAKDEFLAIVSHELRTPITAILGWAHLLRRRISDPEKVERAIEMLERNAVAQTEIIDDILDVSRITTGRLGLRLSPVDLGRTVEAAIDSVRPAADARGVSLVVDIDDRARRFEGDSQRLLQIVWNLLSNAVKFSHRDGRVETTLGIVGGGIEIRVRDEGEGIAPEFLPHVFERFRQEDSGATRVHGGLGLGLSIVKYLVEMHGGVVLAESEGRGHGATLTIRLPRRPGDEFDAAADHRFAATGTGGCEASP